jgi:cellulose synthase (UDP-forming)
MTEESHNGFTVRYFIKDRTVIEDTESSLEMRMHGWRLVNYPERLSYSATPPDFGALCVQRQRWGNGGLLMLPNLLRLARRPDGRTRRAVAAEMFLRLSYLASVSWASAGLWLLLLYPFDQKLLSRWAVLTAVPYFAALATDLHRTGYKRRDVFRLYGLNIMLLPVNTAGAARSIGQAIGGQKSAFARTPKVKKRTVTPLLFVTFPFIISVWSSVTLVNDLAAHRYLHAGFSGVNAAITLYVMLSMHGLLATTSDVAHDIHEWLLRPVRRSGEQARVADWVTVLYHGHAASGETEEGAAIAGALAAIDQESDDDNDILFRLHRPAVPAPEVVAASDDQLAERDVETLSSALSASIRDLRPGNTLLVRMTPDGIEVGHAGDDNDNNSYTDERV